MNILLVLDSLERTWAAALRITRERNANLTALFVLDNTWNVFVGHDWLSGSGSRGDFLDWMRDEEAKTAKVTLEAFGALAADTPHALKTAIGDVREEIIKEAGAGYDLLIMSNPLGRGLEVVRKAVPGIAEHCPCDLLLINRNRPSLPGTPRGCRPGGQAKNIAKRHKNIEMD